MIIRKETSNDYDKVYVLVKSAFATAEHSNGNEQELIVALRKGIVFIPELSLVAEIDEEIVGHILFTKATVESDTILALAPLSVAPKHQKQGIGTALIMEGHRIAKNLGYPYSLVLGSEKYYPRFGYVPAEQFGVAVPNGIPSVNFMIFPLSENLPLLSGTVKHADEFGMQ